MSETVALERPSPERGRVAATTVENQLDEAIAGTDDPIRSAALRVLAATVAGVEPAATGPRRGALVAGFSAAGDEVSQLDALRVELRGDLERLCTHSASSSFALDRPLAAFALCEVLRFFDDARLEDACRPAVASVLASEPTFDRPVSDKRERERLWALACFLESARASGFAVPVSSLAGPRQWVRDRADVLVASIERARGDRDPDVIGTERRELARFAFLLFSFEQSGKRVDRVARQLRRGMESDAEAWAWSGMALYLLGGTNFGFWRTFSSKRARSLGRPENFVGLEGEERSYATIALTVYYRYAIPFALHEGR